MSVYLSVCGPLSGVLLTASDTDGGHFYAFVLIVTRQMTVWAFWFWRRRQCIPPEGWNPHQRHHRAYFVAWNGTMIMNYRLGRILEAGGHKLVSILSQQLPIWQSTQYQVMEGCKLESVLFINIQVSALFDVLKVSSVLCLAGILPTRRSFAMPGSSWRCPCCIQLGPSTRPQECAAAGRACGGIHEVPPQRYVDTEHQVAYRILEISE
jgi:hypothetical protein